MLYTFQNKHFFFSPDGVDENLLFIFFFKQIFFYTQKKLV